MERKLYRWSPSFQRTRSCPGYSSLRSRIALAACGIAILSWAPAPASAKGTKGSKEKAACTSAYKSAIQLHSASRFQEAKGMLASCMKPTCGAVRQKCAARNSQLEADIPSVVPIVKDDAGAPPSEVQGTIDERRLIAEPDGRALPVDPGLHTFAFSNAQGVFATKKVIIAQGEPNRTI